MADASPRAADRIDAWIDGLDEYRRRLRQHNQERFDRLVSRSRLHHVAIQTHNPVDMDTVMLLNMMLAQQREIDAIREKEIADLESRVQRLERQTWNGIEQRDVEASE